MVDATDSKSVFREEVWVRAPPPVPSPVFSAASRVPTRIRRTANPPQKTNGSILLRRVTISGKTRLDCGRFRSFECGHGGSGCSGQVKSEIKQSAALHRENPTLRQPASQTRRLPAVFRQPKMRKGVYQPARQPVSGCIQIGPARPGGSKWSHRPLCQTYVERIDRTKTKCSFRNPAANSLATRYPTLKPNNRSQLNGPVWRTAAL